MGSRKFRIGIFASSQSLIDRIKALTVNQNDNITINTQGLDHAIPIGIAMERKGVEVIVSRRGTAHLLRENLRIPVLSFPHRSLDILNSLKLAAAKGKRILIPVFRNEMSGIAILKDLLGIDIIQGIYQDRNSLDGVITEGRQMGCDVVVGGSVTHQLAQLRGLEYVEIRTSDEDITATIENAKSVARSNREQRAMARRYRSIIDAASDGIIATDERGRVTILNKAARRLLTTGDAEVVGSPMDQLIPGCPVPQVLRSRQTIHDQLGQVKGTQCIFNHFPVLLDQEVIGSVSTFREIGQVMRTENVVRRSLARGLVAKYTLEDLVHTSPTMRDAVNMGRQFAHVDSTILLVGETGTGKEIFAHGIHNLSARSSHPFVAVNCAALPEQLLESELFGYEEGAFTGSKRGGKPGRFEIAHQGTIFLDEIDCTPPSVQIRLLRVLQEREVMRVGGDRKIPIDVRVVTAASRSLNRAVQDGTFREDLFFRLNVLRIQLPAVRDRREDIPLLLNHFIRLFSERNGIDPIRLHDDYLERLKGYAWPGNVRQLRNFAERLVMNCSLRCSPDTLEVLYQELLDFGPADSLSEPPAPSCRALKSILSRRTMSEERDIIRQALTESRFCKSSAARLLNISRTTLWRKIKDLGLD